MNASIFAVQCYPNGMFELSHVVVEVDDSSVMDYVKRDRVCHAPHLKLSLRAFSLLLTGLIMLPTR